MNWLQKNNMSTPLNYSSIYYNQIQSIKFHNFEYTNSFPRNILKHVDTYFSFTQIEETVVTMI